MISTVELFAGNRSFSKVAQEFGYDTFCIDIEQVDGQIDLVRDIMELRPEEVPRPHILWASPPCESFSVSSIGRHWNKDHTPKTEKATKAEMLIERTIALIGVINPDWWFMENPRGKLRKLQAVSDLPLKTVTYCQYGDRRMKPTDIWTNANWWEPRPICKNGDKCHTAAPRGSSTGTQGRESYLEKSKVPEDLFKEIFSQYESKIRSNNPDDAVREPATRL